MKTTEQNRNWTTFPAVWVLAGSVFMGGLIASRASGEPAAASPPPPPAMESSSFASSTGIAEVLKLVDAGISGDIIKGYIRNSATVYTLTAADIIALKQRGVADDIAAAMVQRGTELREQGVQAQEPVRTVYQYSQPVYAYPAYPAYSYGYAYPWPYFYPGISIGFGYGGYYGHYYGYGYHGGYWVHGGYGGGYGHGGGGHGGHH